ncbi:NAD(P)/FAD-dependent oxidoreductase [Exilibacterium tricleocarpae]|uniref:NAD(P)/FAD-dependent oxidoreductase n=1 Tax=Exilibacterium tricleocarpae TaxID=2591008 RepID=A0A545SP20_9GAMM|nr:NAD(P)/FAD-dependent oxidoreductase [Exilibacterium tricleocarpae]
MDVLIIGGGFGGLGMAITLKRAGIQNFMLLEQARSPGGCWRDNTYPGAACDVPSHLYSFSFEKKHDWSRKYASQAEIHDYLCHCVKKYRLASHIRFGTRVVSAVFDERNNHWQVDTDSGVSLTARALITATGQLSQPAYPVLPGLEQFRGTAFHSARWDHNCDLAGKRVAIIGTGASAIQFFPEVAKQAAAVYLFQRSAPYVIPKRDRPYPRWEQTLYRRLPWLQQLSRYWLYAVHEARFLGFNNAVPGLLNWGRREFRRLLARDVKDAGTRARLVPDYPLGCKRILISNDYYATFNRDNVTLVTDPISAVGAAHIDTAQGRIDTIDAIIYGTGFQASAFLSPIRVTGLDGRDLNTAWARGAEAYLGITVSGFPNLFMLYGPNTNLGHNSIIYMLESQYRYVLDGVRLLLKQPERRLNVSADIQRGFNNRIQEKLKHTVWHQGCTSWYKNAEGKNLNNWPGFTFVYRWLTRKLDRRDYIGDNP